MGKRLRRVRYANPQIYQIKQPTGLQIRVQSHHSSNNPYKIFVPVRAFSLLKTNFLQISSLALILQTRVYLVVRHHMLEVLHDSAIDQAQLLRLWAGYPVVTIVGRQSGRPH